MWVCFYVKTLVLGCSPIMCSTDQFACTLTKVSNTFCFLIFRRNRKKHLYHNNVKPYPPVQSLVGSAIRPAITNDPPFCVCAPTISKNILKCCTAYCASAMLQRKVKECFNAPYIGNIDASIIQHILTPV